jgi:hypothetical protein
VEQPLGSRYVLHELLGRGAMGQVFRGTVRASGARVAVKVLKPELVSDTEVVARFFRERSILTSIHHPNVAGVLDLVVEGDTLGIVMELVDGQDLRRYLRRRGTLPPAEAVHLVCQLLHGLAAVHAAGIVHRDVKPENVLLSGQGDLKLTDFGVSRLSYGASLTKMTSLIGTPEYMAPELAEHDRATPAADLYSTGIVLYEMLAGRTPFAGGHPIAVLRRQMEQRPAPIAGVPAELWAQIDSLLAKDPRSRPGSAAALNRLAPLQAMLAGRPALPPMPDRAQDHAQGAMTYPGARDSHVTQAPAGPGQEADQTVLRARNRGQEPAGGAAPARYAAGQADLVPRRPRSRPWTRRRAAVVALPAALVVLAAAVGILLTRSPHSTPRASAAQATASYSFAPARYKDGLLIVRRWTLSGKQGALLTETITASSATGKAVRVKFEEPIPAAIASTLQSVRFTPAPSQIIQADPVVQWDLSVPTRGTVQVGYQATVSPDGITQGRLTQWAKELDAMQAGLNLPKPVTVGVRSLSISPASLNLTAGGSAPLTLTGLLGNGQAAPGSLLAGVAWTSSNQDVAVVEDSADTVVATGAGTAVITAQLGTAQASAVVTVAGTSNLAGGGNNPGAPPVSSATSTRTTSQSPAAARSSSAAPPTTPPPSTATSTPAPATATSSAAPPPTPTPTTYAETTGGVTHTWTDYSDAGGTEGASIASNATVQISCKVTGFKVADGNTWWYRIASSPWNNAYYASADAFYNNGQTSGSLNGTPFVDPNVPNC